MGPLDLELNFNNHTCLMLHIAQPLERPWTIKTVCFCDCPIEITFSYHIYMHTHAGYAVIRC